MSKSVNLCMMTGRLGADPEARVTAGGTSMVNFTIAVDMSYKNKDGEKVEKTEWVRCVAWGKTSEFVSQYCHKGDLVFVLGAFGTRSWDDKDTGKKMYMSEITVDRFNILSSPNRSKDGGQPESGPSSPETGGEKAADDHDLPF